MTNYQEKYNFLKTKYLLIKNHYGGSQVELVYQYSDGTEDVDNYPNIETALLDGEAVYLNYLSEIEGDDIRDRSINVWRRNVWKDYLDESGDTSDLEIRQNLPRLIDKNLNRIQLKVGGIPNTEANNNLNEMRDVTLKTIYELIDISPNVGYA